MTDRKVFASIGAALPEIYFPNEDVDLEKFATIACDQYSAEPEYWEKVEKNAEGHPSALNMILPEAYLGKDFSYEELNRTMQEYIDNGTLRSLGEGIIFIHRETSSGIRKGIVMMLDLEQYGTDPGCLIRPTEMTVKERLPERIKIRKNAPLEMPHTMVLINDEKNTVNAMLDEYVKEKKPLYDFNLFPHGDRITGWFINDESILTSLEDAIKLLKYESILFAMGDGNHSFAAAKEHWIELKKSLSENERDVHPARYSMAEIVNLYDPSLEFEPIHRLVMGADNEDIKNYLEITDDFTPNLQDLQPKLDEYLKDHNEVTLEYIHGAENCKRLAMEKNGLAITWDKFEKESLFPDVLAHGELCRKSFSMGKADDKRFYLECRRIK